MPKPKTDPNQDAARVLREATEKGDGPPADLEVAWAAWSRAIKATDERTMTLLRAAFDAGVDTGRVIAGKAHGRAGGLKGGKARAKALTKERRSEIAKKAAGRRWGG